MRTRLRPTTSLCRSPPAIYGFNIEGKKYIMQPQPVGLPIPAELSDASIGKLDVQHIGDVTWKSESLTT
jgi:hypothetical protein